MNSGEEHKVLEQEANDYIAELRRLPGEGVEQCSDPRFPVLVAGTVLSLRMQKAQMRALAEVKRNTSYLGSVKALLGTGVGGGGVIGLIYFLMRGGG